MSAPKDLSRSAPQPIAQLKNHQEVRQFSDMHLRPGLRIQLQSSFSGDAERHIVNYIGCLNDASFLITPIMVRGQRLELLENEKFIARILTNQKVFGFSTHVLRKCDLPSPYLHMSLPSEIQASLLRKSPRLKIDLFGSAKKNRHAEESLTVQILNISLQGALIKASEAIHRDGEQIVLYFQLKLNGNDFPFEVAATIRSTTQETRSANANGVTHGLEFVDLDETCSINLKNAIYQQIVEYPDSLM